MAFPQTSADQYAVDGYKFFRLNTLLASPGDIYESGQSSQLLCLGPDSDISEVVVAYFDQQQPNLMNQVTISPDRAMSGRLDSNNVGTYTPSGRPGKILMWSGDLWNPNFIPTGTIVAGSSYILETPRLDVIEYFEPQGSVIPKRHDKTWVYQSIPIPISLTNAAYITVPFYGRKFAQVTVDMPTPGRTIGEYQLFGVNLIIGAFSDVVVDGNSFTLDTQLGVTRWRSIVNAGDAIKGGVFDLLVVKLVTDDGGDIVNANVRIVTSDVSSPE